MTVLLADIIDRTDIGMIQRGCCLGLALKPSQGLRVEGDAFWQEFESDETMKPRVLGFVDLAQISSLKGPSPIRETTAGWGSRSPRLSQAAYQS
jgi:hypothetical protein